MLLFLLAAGLSLIFGLIRVLNLAHGSFYLIGAYLGLTIHGLTKSFLLSLLGAAVGLAVWWLQEKTRLGAMIRAGVDDGEMARGMGVNTSLLFTIVFALGAGLAAAGGVLGGVIVGVHPGIDLEVLLFAFVVVII